MNAGGGGWIFDERRSRTPRPRHQFAAAVGTAPTKNTLGAIGAEGAFEGTDPRVRRFGREIFVAAFAART